MITDEQLRRDLVWFLRTCADAVERGDLDIHDVRQALFDARDYSIACPVSETRRTGQPANSDHAEIIEALDDMANAMYLIGRPEPS